MNRVANRQSVAAAEPRGRPKKGGRAAPARRATLERADWLAAARKMLIREGIGAVKVDRVARALKVSRGGFYWRFKGHADLLDALLADWRERNSGAILGALGGSGTPIERFEAGVKVWIDEVDFDPAYDKAVREWARTSKKVAKALGAVDDERIEALHQLFLDAGEDDDEAFIRARVVYYHQVGYYAMEVKESPARRRELARLYVRVLTGFS